MRRLLHFRAVRTPHVVRAMTPRTTMIAIAHVGKFGTALVLPLDDLVVVEEGVVAVMVASTEFANVVSEKHKIRDKHPGSAVDAIE